MSFAIIGSGAIGHALATQFARCDIDVLVANQRGPASLVGFGLLFLLGGWKLEQLRRKLVARTAGGERAGQVP